jgi:hypothetical protein
MTMTRHRTAPDRPAAPAQRRPAAMYIGLGLTVLATAAPLIDVATADTLAQHVRDAYPSWGPALVAEDRNAMLIYLLITGGLGIITWLWTLWAVTTRKRWARPAATAALAAGAGIAVLNLTLGGGNYRTILPPAYGLLTLLPALAGLAAVASLWRGRHRLTGP